MTTEEAYRRLPEYLEGGMPASERAEIERLLQHDPELQRSRALLLSMEAVLQNQTWRTPSADFTRAVMARIEHEAPQPVPASFAWWEWARLILSAAALSLIVILHGETLLSWIGHGLSDAGLWVGSHTGYTLFSLHPVILLGLAAPLLAGGYATCVLTGRCRLSS